MKIRLGNHEQVQSLLQFLRDHGSIAYATDNLEAVEALLPHASGQREAEELRALVEAWVTEHPDAEVDIEL
jgi:tRNA G46 methylase TrmB